MQLYYPDMQAIDQQTRQLALQPCLHCLSNQHLVSHAYVYNKCTGAEPEAVGKRVFCSNRGRHTGCGRTIRLYLDHALRHFHYAGTHLVAFVLALLSGIAVQQAYQHATGCSEPRHAWRWLRRLQQQLPSYRSLRHSPALPTSPSGAPVRHPVRHALLASTFDWLLHHFGHPLCCNFQRQLQHSFLP